MAAAKRKPKPKSPRFQRKVRPDDEPEVIPPNADGPAPNLRGRPRAITDDDYAISQLRGLGQIGCTIRECAAVIGVHENTLHAFFVRKPEAREAYDDAIQTGKASLRRRQIEVAMRDGPGTATMLVWLGKNLLGQREPSENQKGFENIDVLDQMYEDINKIMREAEEQRFQRATLIEDKTK